MRTVFRISMLVVLGVLVGAGCGKRAKLDLSGLEDMPAGSVEAEKGVGDNVVDGDGLLPLSGGDEGALGIAGIGAGGNGAGGNGAAAPSDLSGIDPNAPAGGWQDTAAGLAAGTGSSFVKDGNYWAEKVYFDFNRYEVRASERAKLDALAEHLRAHPTFRVVIEGHCDDRGSDEYNRALSERRSLSVQTYLLNLGIEESRMHTVSYGEDRPAVQGARTESEHQQNRRAEFLVGLPE